MKAFTQPRIQKSNGFSLIVTVTLLVLLSLISVALLSLSTTTIRSSQNGEAQALARANARLALQVALGELQNTMGPDTRVSANAEILSSQRTVATGREKVTGVWNAWYPDFNNVGDYDSKKRGTPRTRNDSQGFERPDGGFHRWLVSTADNQSAEDIEFITRSGSEQQVILADTRSNGNNTEPVQAGRVPLTDNEGNSSGQYAWVVLDEGQKASTELNFDENSQLRSTNLQKLALQEEPRWENVTEWQQLGQLDTEERQKLITLDSLELGGVSESRESFHDLTTSSKTVLADVTKGVLKTDLSLLFSQEELPADFQSRRIYSQTKDPLIPAPSRGQHSYSFPSPDPSWSILHKYHRIPKDLFNENTRNPRLTFQMDSDDTSNNTIPFRPVGNQGGTDDDRNGIIDYHESLKFSPVISKAQFFFSIAYGQGNDLNSNNGAWRRDGGQGRSRWKYQVAMFIDPVITLWNPYDVPIDVNGFRIFLYRVPLEFHFQSNNPDFRSAPPEQYTTFVDAISGSGANAAAVAYPLRILPERGSSSVELLPGEHRVFSAHNVVGSWLIGNGGTSGSQDGREIQMRPGFYPPGSNSSRVGGISTVTLNKERGRDTASYLAGRRWYNTRAVLVGASEDTLTISVRPTTDSVGSFSTVGDNVDFYLRYGADGEKTEIRSGGEQAGIPDFGAIELDYGEDIEDILPKYVSSQNPTGGESLPQFPAGSQEGRLARIANVSIQNSRNNKEPFLVATLHLKSLTSDEYRSKFPAKAWLHNNPIAIYSSAGFGDQNQDYAAHQYEFSYQPLRASWFEGFPEIEPTSDRFQGFGGPSPSAGNGRVFAPFTSLPREEPTSLGQYRHAPINNSGKQPLQAQVIGNSFAHPLLDADSVLNRSSGFADHSFLANQVLFDSSFLSTAENHDELVNVLSDDLSLINQRLQPVSQKPTQEEIARLQETETGHNYSAAHLMLSGALNVNSTSVKAWQSFLTFLNQEEIPLIDDLTDPSLGETLNNSQRAPIASRYQVPIEETLGTAAEASSDGATPAWTGHRRLDSDEIEQLAESLVEEIKERGPFQSLGEFINRRAEDSRLGIAGTLQTAIQESALNREVERGSVATIPLTGQQDGSGDFQYRDAAKGTSIEGTPGMVTQADLLHTLAPYLTPRSDTFRIRAYGSATNKSGRVISEAWCEAIVQRFPEYIDSSDKPYASVNNEFSLNETNQKFGRRFRIQSFRWLSPLDSTI